MESAGSEEAHAVDRAAATYHAESLRAARHAEALAPPGPERALSASRADDGRSFGQGVGAGAGLGLGVGDPGGQYLNEARALAALEAKSTPTLAERAAKAKPWECKKCLERFPTKMGLLSHQKVHRQEEQRYRCKGCQRGYSYHNRYITHLLSCKKYAALQKGLENEAQIKLALPSLGDLAQEVDVNAPGTLVDEQAPALVFGSRAHPAPLSQRSEPASDSPLPDEATPLAAEQVGSERKEVPSGGAPEADQTPAVAKRPEPQEAGYREGKRDWDREEEQEELLQQEAERRGAQEQKRSTPERIIEKLDPLPTSPRTGAPRPSKPGSPKTASPRGSKIASSAASRKRSASPKSRPEPKLTIVPTAWPADPDSDSDPHPHPHPHPSPNPSPNPNPHPSPNPKPTADPHPRPNSNPHPNSDPNLDPSRNRDPHPNSAREPAVPLAFAAPDAGTAPSRGAESAGAVPPRDAKSRLPERPAAASSEPRERAKPDTALSLVPPQLERAALALRRRVEESLPTLPSPTRATAPSPSPLPPSLPRNVEPPAPAAAPFETTRTYQQLYVRYYQSLSAETLLPNEIVPYRLAESQERGGTSSLALISAKIRTHLQRLAAAGSLVSPSNQRDAADATKEQAVREARVSGRPHGQVANQGLHDGPRWHEVQPTSAAETPGTRDAEQPTSVLPTASIVDESTRGSEVPPPRLVPVPESSGSPPVHRGFGDKGSAPRSSNFSRRLEPQRGDAEKAGGDWTSEENPREPAPAAGSVAKESLARSKEPASALPSEMEPYSRDEDEDGDEADASWRPWVKSKTRVDARSSRPVSSSSILQRPVRPSAEPHDKDEPPLAEDWALDEPDPDVEPRVPRRPVTDWTRRAASRDEPAEQKEEEQQQPKLRGRPRQRAPRAGRSASTGSPRHANDGKRCVHAQDQTQTQTQTRSHSEPGRPPAWLSELAPNEVELAHLLEREPAQPWRRAGKGTMLRASPGSRPALTGLVGEDRCEDGDAGEDVDVDGDEDEDGRVASDGEAATGAAAWVRELYARREPIAAHERLTSGQLAGDAALALYRRYLAREQTRRARRRQLDARRRRSLYAKGT